MTVQTQPPALDVTDDEEDVANFREFIEKMPFELLLRRARYIQLLPEHIPYVPAHIA